VTGIGSAGVRKISNTVPCNGVEKFLTKRDQSGAPNKRGIVYVV